MGPNRPRPMSEAEAEHYEVAGVAEEDLGEVLSWGLATVRELYAVLKARGVYLNVEGVPLMPPRR